jgi:hypothetical protein
VDAILPTPSFAAAQAFGVLKAAHNRTRYLLEDVASRLQFVKHKNEG